MQIISDITKYATIFFIMLIIMCAIAAAVIYYLLKVKKIASKEELFDYSKFDRKDSLEYVRFDRIINSKENGVQTKNGIIILDDGMRFIAGLKVSGYNFFTASAQEQHQSMKGMISFLNAIEGDVQYRQSTKAIDLSENIEKHKKRMNEVELEIYGLRMDHEDLVEKAEAYVDMPDIFQNYHERLLEIEKNINCKTHTRQELDVLIQYMEALSGTNLESEKVQCWMFEWKYNANDYIEELNESEKFEKAASELSTKAGSYIAALLRTGCTCERMSGEEILELFRYHYSPITSDVYKVGDLYDSSIGSLYITSDSLDALAHEAEDEKEYNMFMNEQRAMEFYDSQQRSLNDEDGLSFADSESLSDSLDFNDDMFANESDDLEFAEDVIVDGTEEDVMFSFAMDDGEESDEAFSLGEELDESYNPSFVSAAPEKDSGSEYEEKTENKSKKKSKKKKEKEVKLEGQMSMLDGITFGNGVK